MLNCKPAEVKLRFLRDGGLRNNNNEISVT